ncbi:MAG: peptide-methionine (S)-S-oxide reductase MsrA [Candidatus Doudnabacteria bacterium]|nr:peptide-methionine (S)-S-oxide reductase MsrA [bacterium]MDZ4243555.1 peptide-methionine (S)-S-oxide reductase MsrA [Candidatus Doudnabacteria bacterium]
METAVFGGGCFWCTEAVFNELRGVISVMPGYAGGTIANPTYEQVSSGQTGHAEVTKIKFNRTQISFKDLLTVFFATHDSTTLNRQDNDTGTQYRSVIFYTDDEQKREAENFIAGLKSNGTPAVTEVKPLEKFYVAEDYHRQYYQNNPDQPYCQLVIDPKLKKLKQTFTGMLNKKAP